MKLSTSLSKSKFGRGEAAAGRALVGVGRGRVTTGVGDGLEGAAVPSTIFNKFCKALPPWVGLGAAAVGRALGLDCCCLAGCWAWKLLNCCAGRGCGRLCACGAGLL